METLKIALIAPPYRPVTPEYADYGGIEVGVGNLAEYFDNKGHEVHLYSSTGDTSWVPKNGQLWAIGIWTDYMSGKFTPESYWAMIQKHKPAFDVIKDADIVNNNDMKQVFHEIKTKHFNENYISSVHAMDPQLTNVPAGAKLRLTAPSYHLAKVMSRLNYGKWVFRGVHPGPVKKERYPFQRKKGERLLYLGRLYKPKGAHRAIRIADNMKIPIDIVGGSEGDDPEYVEHIRQLCEKSKYATMHGKVSFEKKVEFLQNARCVVLPVLEFYNVKGDNCSFYVEPFGNISVEAGMCGTPCVVSVCGGWAETVTDGLNGFYAYENKEFEYAIEKIDQINPYNCRRRALYFDAEKGGQRYLELFKHVLTGDIW